MAGSEKIQDLLLPCAFPRDAGGCWRHFWSKQENSTSDMAAKHVLDGPRPNPLQPPRASVLRKNSLLSTRDDSGFLRLPG